MRSGLIIWRVDCSYVKSGPMGPLEGSSYNACIMTAQLLWGTGLLLSTGQLIRSQSSFLKKEQLTRKYRASTMKTGHILEGIEQLVWETEPPFRDRATPEESESAARKSLGPGNEYYMLDNTNYRPRLSIWTKNRRSTINITRLSRIKNFTWLYKLLILLILIIFIYCITIYV
jgi:hypothetical protein